MEEVFMEDLKLKLKLNLDNDDVDVEECEYDSEIIPVELKYDIKYSKLTIEKSFVVDGFVNCYSSYFLISM